MYSLFRGGETVDEIQYGTRDTGQLDRSEEMRAVDKVDEFASFRIVTRWQWHINVVVAKRQRETELRGKQPIISVGMKITIKAQTLRGGGGKESSRIFAGKLLHRLSKEQEQALS